MSKDNKLQQQKAAPSGKKVRLGTATAVALSSLAAYQGFNAIAATATLPMVARLVRAIEITVNTTLNFGTLAMTVDRDGQARIDPAANQLFIDGSSSLSLAGGEPRAGRIQVKGSNFPVAVSLADTQVRMTNGTDTVLVSNFNLVTANGGTRFTVTPSPGTFSFSVPVGATINTRSQQLTGEYVGSTQIYANYQ